MDEGKIKALWVIATNPAHSWIGKGSFADTIKKLDYLVVQDLYPNTQTALMADLYLPAAASAEKTGSFINSERRIGAACKAVEPPGEARSDFEIFRALAIAWGAERIVRRWSSPQEAFGQLQKLSRGMPCDITGIKDYDHILQKGGIQWPYKENGPAEQEETERRLFADGEFFTPSGKAKLLFDPLRDPEEMPDSQYPLVLITGRGSVFQFHTLTRTDKAPFLKRKSRPDCYVEINPADAERLGIENGSKVLVKSRRADIEATAEVCDNVSTGQVFMPMHYEETNLLTFPSFDPYSFEPSYKYAAVAVKAKAE